MHAYLVVDLYITAMMVDAKTAAENTTVHTTRVAMMATTAELSDATAVPSLSDWVEVKGGSSWLVVAWSWEI